MLHLSALITLPVTLFPSLRTLMVAFRTRREEDARRAVRWATFALLHVLALALIELSLVFIHQARDVEVDRWTALRVGVRAAIDMYAPPLGVAGALRYLSWDMLRAVRRRA